jgi:hypothetical protein
VDLVRRQEMLRLDAKRLRHAAAVLADMIGLILGPDPAVERRVNALRHAAGPREERVANAVESGQRSGVQHADLIGAKSEACNAVSVIASHQRVHARLRRAMAKQSSFLG